MPPVDLYEVGFTAFVEACAGRGKPLAEIAGVSFRSNGGFTHNPDAPAIVRRTVPLVDTAAHR